jgi:hypothetical protein
MQTLKLPTRLPIELKHHLKPRGEPGGICNQSGVYQLQCSEFPLKYNGQTGRTFKVRYREHTNTIRTNRQNSKFSQHFLETRHEYDTLDQTMEIIHITKERAQAQHIRKISYIRHNQEGSINERYIYRHK